MLVKTLLIKQHLALTECNFLLIFLVAFKCSLILAVENRLQEKMILGTAPEIRMWQKCSDISLLRALKLQEISRSLKNNPRVY